MNMAPAAVHVLVFPWPLQGHINSMLPFAAGLLDAGLHVTFLHTEHNLRHVGQAHAASPRLRFLSIPDGLPHDHPRSVADLPELGQSLWTKGAAAYRALLASLLGDSAGVVGAFPPVTCVVADGLLPFAIDVAEELGVPALAFGTASACSLLAFLSVPRLVELGELPFPVGADLDEPVRGVPGMTAEGVVLRRRDLPSFARGRSEANGVDPSLQRLAEHAAHSSRARALVLNTAASLERSALAHIAPHTRDVYAVGPLHALPAAAPVPAIDLWRPEGGCVEWLDGHEDRSVVYVSFGSLTVISLEQFTEFFAGLAGAGHPFLWALRPDTVASSGPSVREAVKLAGDCQARVVEWAPQRGVLRHRAVGCFVTHAGWNSTLEGVAEGVPLVCWPFFSDQNINSWLVGAVWRTGLDMKDVCDRAVVEKTVRAAMESAELRRSAQALAEQVRRDVADGGSSASELKRLVGFIRELSTNAMLSGK